MFDIYQPADQSFLFCRNAPRFIFFNNWKVWLKRPQLTILYFDSHGFANTADSHFADMQPGCDVPCGLT